MNEHKSSRLNVQKSNILTVKPLATSTFKLSDNFDDFLINHLKDEDLEGKVLAITSKIISLAEKRIVPKGEISKRDLVKREADVYLGEGGYDIELTIKHNILIPSAGIDESNAEGDFYILFPEDPFASAQRIWKLLKHKFNLKNLGILVTDSHCEPLRQGVTGICLSYWGFKPIRSLIGEKDLFGRELKFTHVNIADSLAAAAVLMMGESRESQPLALIEAPALEFTEAVNPKDLCMPLEKDLFKPVLFPKN